MRKNNWFETKLSKLHKYYDKVQNVWIFYCMVLSTFVLLVVGISLTAVHASTYQLFVAVQTMLLANEKTDLIPPDITPFIYGLFFLVTSILLLIFTALFGNSTFNQKLHQKASQ